LLVKRKKQHRRLWFGMTAQRHPFLVMTPPEERVSRSCCHCSSYCPIVLDVAVVAAMVAAVVMAVAGEVAMVAAAVTAASVCRACNFWGDEGGSGSCGDCRALKSLG
jgi:hypothetical protein